MSRGGPSWSPTQPLRKHGQAGWSLHPASTAFGEEKESGFDSVTWKRDPFCPARARVHRAAVRLVLLRELSEVIVLVLDFIDDTAAPHAGFVVASVLEGEAPDVPSSGNWRSRFAFAAPPRRLQ
jgi:hypothetical protein